MEEIKIDELLDEIEFKDKPLISETGEDQEKSEEEIRFFVPPKKVKNKRFIIRFLLTTAVFFLLFLSCYYLSQERQAGNSKEKDANVPTAVTPDTSGQEGSSSTINDETQPLPLIIDESKANPVVNINKEYSLNHLMQASNGMKILIVHSHNSEYVSESDTVSDAGRVIAQLLVSAGIETYHCETEHDTQGNIGSYSRMKNTLAALTENYPDTVCVIDLHDSDSGLPVTFTVGTDCDGWRENLRLAEAVCARMTKAECAFRFIPDKLGQDSGVLTLNIGIGSKSTSQTEARMLIASFAEAFIEICNEKASAP